ncbi:MAG: hypothetical protein ACTICE_00695, partial [Psychrobacter celer]
FKRATGINFTCVLRSQRLRKIHPSSAMTFLECINYIRYLKKQTQRDLRLQKSLLHGPSSGNTASFYVIYHSSEKY